MATGDESFTRVANPLGTSYEDELHRKHSDILGVSQKIVAPVREALEALRAGLDEDARKKLEDIFNKQIVQTLETIQSKVVRIVTCGGSGHGKSFSVNTLLVSKALLESFSVPEDYYGKCPIPSREGYKDVTRNHIIAKYSEEWTVSLEILNEDESGEAVTSKPIPDLNLLKKLKKLGLDRNCGTKPPILQMEYANLEEG